MTDHNLDSHHSHHLGQRWIVSRPMGLGRVLQQAGYGTRKAAEAIVLSGRVRVNGKMETDPKIMVDFESEIQLDNEYLREVLNTYIALNKPARTACGSGEGDSPQTVSEILPPNVPGLRPSGRMDARNTGLLLVSNDKDWNTALAESSVIEHEYRIQVEGQLNELEVGVICAGITIPKMGTFKPLSVRVVETMNGKTVLNIVLTDGKIRQLRRMFSTLRHKIIYLRRIRIGDVRLGNLPPGEHRHLTTREVQAIRSLAGMKT